MWTKPNSTFEFHCCNRSSFVTATNFEIGSTPVFIAVGDFNADTFSDLAVANQFSNNTSILLGNGTGSFGTATNFAAGIFPLSSPRSVAVGFFNAYTFLDLAVADFGLSKISIFLGTGTGSFSPPNSFAVGLQPTSVAVGNFN